MKQERRFRHVYKLPNDDQKFVDLVEMNTEGFWLTQEYKEPLGVTDERYWIPPDALLVIMRLSDEEMEALK